MAAEEEPDALKIYWDHFFKSETGTYEKSTWLELFLAEFIIRLNNGADAKKLIQFCPLSGVVTLVGCELLCGVHRVSSSISTHAVGLARGDADVMGHTDRADHTERVPTEVGRSEEEFNRPTSLFSRNNAQSTTETLRRFVLAGVPWRCLVLLRALGVEGLSCCRQLSSVLIWLVGELGATEGPHAPLVASSPPTTSTPPTSLAEPSTSGATPVFPTTPSARRPLIHELFSRRIWLKQKPSGILGTKQSCHASPAKGFISSRLSHSFRTKMDLEGKAKQRLVMKSEQSSDTGDSNDDLQIINRSISIKVCSPSDDFDYFNLAKRSSNDYPSKTLYSDPFYSPRKAKPKADDFMTDKHREIINSEIGTFEFTLIITDLLQQLCKAESSLSGSEGSQISMQCINFALKNLCSLQFGSLPDHSSAYKPLEMSRVKLALTELLIVSLDQVLIHSDLCAKLINNGILPMLLRILEDIICKSNAKIKVERQNRAKIVDISSETESKNLLYFVFGIAYSITAFFHCLLMQCRSVDKLREFTDQFKLYGECFKGGLLKECIELMIRLPGTDKEETVLLIKKLIESIGRLISAMKRVRSEVIHSAACPRKRHKACCQRVVAGMHHHHDILGEAGSGLPIPSSCCVSIMYGTLVSLVPDEEVAAQKVLRNKILSVMLKCGVCCCLSPNFLMESIVRLMLTHHTVASHCLHLLEHTVYGDLGASVLIPRVTDQLPCSICEQSDGNRDLGRKYCPHGVSPMDRKSVWSFLIHYNSLLQLDNHNDVLHATVGHLLKVTPKCRTEMKYELLFSVIYPTFIVAKHRYIMRSEEAAYFLTASCLSVFASLLNTVSFAEQFIQKGGLSYVLELVALPEFSNRCCAILEIAIVVEIFKLTKENEEMTHFREMRSLASVQMLVKSLMNVTERCHNIYREKIAPEKFDELCDLIKVREALGWDNVPESEQDPMEACVGSEQGRIVEGENDLIEVLKNACTFWKCCAGLCLYSPWFRRWVSRGALLLRSIVLLRLLLHRLCSADAAADVDDREARALIKIMEALLTVQFAVADSTSGRSKVVSCAVVRKALAARAAACGRGAEGGGGLRALCDALLAVAVARPSGRHTMPRLAPSKVPPLFCPSRGSSDCSSSEDSAAGPYVSENSDPRLQPDDGYEADVEFGKLDVLGSFKMKNVADPLLALSTSSHSQSQECISGECPEYDRHGELAHPELCVIVVDIVSQLIDGLLSEKCSGESRNKSVEELERVCAGLARAWGASGESAGATDVASAGESAPSLLVRLLAPRAPATRLLAQHHADLHDLQRAVLSLVVGAARRRLSARELAALLRLFASPRPPLAPLLRALQRLLAQQRPHAPDHELLFPVSLSSNPDESPRDESVASSFSQQAEIQSHRLHLSHLRAGVVSPWAVGAARCGMDGAGWAPWAQGFALVAWLQLQPPAPSEDESAEWLDEMGDGWRGASRGGGSPMHVFSVGHDSLMFELWADLATGWLSIRLSRPEARANRIVSGGRSSCALPLRRTTCLALNVRERVSGRRIHLHVTIYIDGRECETISLPVQGILVRKPTPVNVVFGHACATGAGSARGTLRVASVRVYRAPVLNAPAAAHLAAHGPNQPCQIGCEPPNFPSIITPEILDMDIDWDQVFEVPSSTLRELHAQQLLALSAHAPDHVLLYPQYTPAPTVWGGRGTAAGAGEPPRTVRCSWAGPPRVSVHRGFAPALLLLGGPDLLLYLFARVVELEGSAEEQAAALALVLRACALDARLAGALHAVPAPRLLLPVLAAPQCRLSTSMLQVILSEACSAPVLSGVAEQGTGGVVLCIDTRAVILEPRLIKLLFRAWRNFETAQVSWEEAGRRRSGTAWALALAAVRALLRQDHPYAAFNRYQAARVDLLRHLLFTTKERFLNSECGGLDEHASDCLVGVARALLADSSAQATPPLNELALLADFLLLMHQASDTFVTHTRATFYFLLSADTQESSDFNFLKFIAKRAKADFSVSPSDAAGDLSLGDLTTGSDRDTYRDSESDRTDAESGVESTKHLKGIINRKIKEGRRTVSTSTSENSDGALEEKNELGNGNVENIEEKTKDKEKEVHKETNNGEDTFNGFVIVNESDLNGTGGDATDGSYHQQRAVGGVSGVRAGAEPGWRACEGLLLLLRDALAALPLDQLAQATSAVVQPELVAVLANHRTASVRAAVVRVARELLRRAPSAAQPSSTKYFYAHLANQVSLYGVSCSLAEACCALLTDADVPLAEQLDAKVWAGFAEENAVRAPPLLALLPLVVRDVPLAHNLVAVLRRFVDKVSIKALSEVALVEVVVRAIRAVGLEEQDYEGKELLLEDLSDLLNRVAVKTLEGNNSMQSILDTHLLLRFIECEAGGDEGGESSGGAEGGASVRGAARAAQAALFTAQLDALQLRLRRSAHEPTRRPTYFSNVLSSAAERSEAAETRARLAAVQTRAVSFLTTREWDPPQPAERALFCRLLDALLHECSSGTGGGGRRGGVGGSVSELFWWAATPSLAARPLQIDLLRALYRAPPIALAQLVPHNRDPTALRKLAVYLLSLLRYVHLEAERGMCGVELAITDWARDWAVGSQAALAERLDSDALPAEAERLRRADRVRRLANAPRRRAAIGKAVFAREAQARALADAAMAATRLVVDAQNAERKAFLEQLRASGAAAAAAAARWQRLLGAHTHERGVWYDARAAPAAWQLDDVEGPGRVRVRLRRAHLRISPRFLKPPYKYKSERALAPAPLRAVLGAGGGGAGAAARLAAGEAVQHTARVRRVTVAHAAAGELLLTDRRLHWVPEEDAEPLCVPLRALAAVATRRWCLRECALELFLRSGRAHLFAFEDQTERAAFLKQLARAHLPERTEQDSLAEAMNQWRVGALTNWEYLMILNGLAGRSYNDLMQYPVLPFVIADYTSKILDLTDPASFRDLSRPMAIQNRNREQHYINTYNDLQAARRDGCSPLLSRWPHHYASLYSNSGGVLHYLVRLPPFTELFLNYQDNNFDMPDRTFHSLATTWRLITNDSPTDVKELIPELFYLPELFYNNEGLDLGVRQCGLRVDDVQLPQWAADARLFTLVHRQALEAPVVTERLPLWIDLVFGYKQTGQAAIDAINVFPACTYYGFDPSALEHQVDRNAADAMVRTYGQAPRQLLRQPHPQRAPDLAPPPPPPPAQVYAGAVGARWGRYCGSPERPGPREVGRRSCSGATRLQALANPRAVAAAPPHVLLLLLRDEWAAPGDGENEALCAISWGHADGLLRLRRRRDMPPEPLLQLPHIEQVTSTCGWSGGGGGDVARGAVGALGLSSGRVLALRVRGGPVPRLAALPLLAHAAPVSALALCPQAGLLASASDDGVVVLWDLDELTYIRTLPNRGRLRVQCLAISETLSDLCSAHDPPAPKTRAADDPPDWLADSDADIYADTDHADADVAHQDNADSDAYERDDTYKYRTLLRVHTVNGRFVGSVKVMEGVTCMQYSNAPEGASANCVAAGLRSGGVRLYSSWELRPVAFLPPPSAAPAPLLSLAYGGDSSVLFSCYADGTVLAWESLDTGARPQPLRIVPAHALL